MTGNTYDGTWDLSDAITASKKLEFTFVDDQPIPYLYTGANTIRIDNADDGAGDVVIGFDVAFGQLSSPRDAPATAAALLADINTALGGVGSLVTVSTVVFNALTYAFDLVLLPVTASITWDWGHANTTAAAVFGFANAALNTSLAWNATYVDPRPPVLEVLIAEAKNVVKSTRASLATMVVNISDTHESDVNSFLFDATHALLTITWCRCTAPGVPVPMNNDWHLKFVPA